VGVDSCCGGGAPSFTRSLFLGGSADVDKQKTVKATPTGAACLGGIPVSTS
jgi:hypothetical protein